LALVNIAITGFMGAGKSTTGRRLAKLLGIPFVDTDAEIERAHGPITDIFSREGETQFRRYEAEVIERLSSDGPHVVAVGGGAVIDPANRAMLRRGGYIVNLALRPETAHKRVAHRSHRPLLGPAPSLEGLRALMQSRSAAYADNDLSIAVDSRTPQAVAHIIARWYRKRLAPAQSL
jgi:shikimate kinase